MIAARFVFCAIAFYNAGAHDWRGVLGVLSGAAAIEFAAFDHRRRERRRRNAWDQARRRVARLP